MQEVWSIPKYFKTNIPGYKPIVHKLRNQMDNLSSIVGGGVACLVKNEHNFEVLENIFVLEFSKDLKKTWSLLNSIISSKKKVFLFLKFSLMIKNVMWDLLR